MSNVDWSKAPEGATHYVAGCGFFKTDLAGWFVCDDGEKVWRKTLYESPENFYWWGNAVQRPAAPQWNGEGLPPVGAVVEWFSPAYGWLGGRVVGHDGMVAVISHNDGYIGCHPHEVRPIRTPEQLAAEAREKAVEEMWSVYWKPHAATAKEGLGLLYDAGYRKLEQPE